MGAKYFQIKFLHAKIHYCIPVHRMSISGWSLSPMVLKYSDLPTVGKDLVLQYSEKKKIKVNFTAQNQQSVPNSPLNIRLTIYPDGS